MKKVIALCLVLALCAALAACGGTPAAAETSTSEETTQSTAASTSGIQKVLEKGELVVGCSPVVEGVCFQDPESGEYVGMIPDIINGYAEEMGVTVKWEPLEWSTLIPATSNGKVDMIAAHMTMTMERTASVTFTDPWIVDASMACVRTDSDFQTLEDLNQPGVKIGSGEGSSYNELIPQLFPNAELVILPTTAWQDALKTGRIDAMYDDSISFPGPISRSDGELRLIDEKQGAFLYGFGVPLGDEIFKDSLNVYLATIKTDGRYGEIYSKWFGLDWTPNANGSAF